MKAATAVKIAQGLNTQQRRHEPAIATHLTRRHAYWQPDRIVPLTMETAQAEGRVYTIPYELTSCCRCHKRLEAGPAVNESSRDYHVYWSHVGCFEADVMPEDLEP